MLKKSTSCPELSKQSAGKRSTAIRCTPPSSPPFQPTFPIEIYECARAPIVNLITCAGEPKDATAPCLETPVEEAALEIHHDIPPGRWTRLRGRFAAKKQGKK